MGFQAVSDREWRFQAAALKDREGRAGSRFLAPGSESSDRNFLAGQGLVHGDRKIASQLSPVLVTIGPSA